MRSGEPHQKSKLTEQPLFRVGIILVLVLVLFFGLQQLFIPESFGEVGHYRSDNIREWTEHELQFSAGSETCLTCHVDLKNDFLGGKHGQLNCETCHGPAIRHPENPTEFKPSLETSREFCGSCHQILTGRPETSITQIDLENHMGSANCNNCHRPHHPELKLGGARQ